MPEAIPEQNEGSKEAIRAAAEAKAAGDAGDWDGARAAMAKAIDADANNAGYHALMAWYTWQCSIQPAFERQRLAEHHLSVALEMDPENAQAHYYQGLIWAGGGNTTRARIALATALNLKPNFQAAATALDKLSKVSETSTSASKEMERTTFARPHKTKAKLVLPLAIATLLMGAGGGAAMYFSGQQPGISDLAKQLGTKLPLVSASRAGSSGQDLHLDVGKAWGALGAGDQTNELHNIARGAQAMKIVNVFVYSESQPVGEIHGESVCVGDCVVKPAMQPNRSGQTATLKVAKH
jgi:tetratricopeptide (TPR) repeat protein